MTFTKAKIVQVSRDRSPITLLPRLGGGVTIAAGYTQRTAIFLTEPELEAVLDALLEDDEDE